MLRKEGRRGETPAPLLYPLMINFSARRLGNIEHTSPAVVPG
jgi:hypothetical protein